MATPPPHNEARSDVAGASNVLLLAPSLGSVETEACADLLTSNRADELDVLTVTFTDTPDQRLREWRAHVGEETPANMCVVTVGDSTRSVAAATTTTDIPNLVTRTVSEPGNLTSLGVRLTEQLSDWQGTGNQVLLDFDSLTALLHYASRDKTFQFLHVLRGRLDARGALAHYHMDPSVHDERTINTFKSLMDAVVTVADDGTWTVSSA